MTALKYWNGTAWIKLSGTGQPGIARPPVLNTTAAYTLALSDASTMIVCNHTGAQTITVPPNATVAFSVGIEIDVLWWNTNAAPLIIAGAGVTVVGVPGLKLRVRYSAATLKQIVANSWVLIGDLSL